MRIAVFGGTGRTGRQVVTQALAAGHEVRVLVRSEDSARRLGRHDRLTAVVGTFEQPGPTEAVVKGAGAVISTLGATVEGPTTVCTDGVRAILAAMGRQGVRRLLVLSAHGVGDSHDRSPYVVAVWALRGHRMRDKETMEELIRAADIDATIVRLPALTEGPPPGDTVPAQVCRSPSRGRSAGPTWPISCWVRPSPVPTAAKRPGSSRRLADAVSGPLPGSRRAPWLERR